MISLHTSPLLQPGSGDSGGMNVNVREVASALVQPTRGVFVGVGGLLAAYLALLRRGLPCRLRCRKTRWALTPPFHPYHDLLWRCLFCGTFRHGFRRAQELPGALPMEPGLSSSQSPKRSACDCPAAHAFKYSAS